MRRLTIFCTFVALAANCVSAKSVEVALGDVASALKTATAGDVITIKSGTYKDVSLRWQATGSEGKPITVKASQPGEVHIEGASNLRVAGEWLNVEGLYFRNGYSPSGAVIEYRNGDDVANNCRVTNCVVDSYNPSKRNIQYSYVIMYGRQNRFDHNTLTGQLNLGVTLIVMLNEERSRDNHHSIDHNYFGDRPVYGSNGAETIRVGTSQQAYESSRTVIESNYFSECNGEVEVVSIKSSDNIVRGNTFYRCQGVVALRHGDRNTVEGNLFAGYGDRNTGGVRVVNAGHTVRGNLFWKLTGYRFFGALTFMNAVPNSLPNRYCLVENITVEDNVLVDCDHIEFGTGKDEERTLSPTRITFRNNIIYNPKAAEPYRSLGELTESTFAGNLVKLSVPVRQAGFSDGNFTMARLDDIQIPVVKGRKLAQYGVQKQLAGASWHNNNPKVHADLLKRQIKVAAGQDALLEAVRNSQPFDQIILTDAGGDYAVSAAIEVPHYLNIKAQEGLAKKPVVRFNGTKTDNMITIADGGSLWLQGILFDGTPQDGRAIAKAGISTPAGMIQQYAMDVIDCEFCNFGEGGMFAIRALANTFAREINIRNCTFRDLSGDAINFADEKDDMGRYNAERINITNCLFYRLLGLGINIYRGGSDESTAGPEVLITRCTFVDVCNKERGSVMRLIGPQVMTISGCNFVDSGRGGAAIRLDEATWELISVERCNFWNSGRILTMTGKVVKGEKYNIEPQFQNPSTSDYSIKPGTELSDKKIGIF